MSNSRRLKDLLARRAAVTVPGAANALFARVIEDLGFEAVYVTGAGIANMLLGAPDIGLTTMTEVSETVAAIADAVSVPVIVDADTGYGNALNMQRTVRTFERAGAAGIQIEDQVFPKKCGHFAGKHVIATEEMVQKIKAAVDARHDQSLQIIARTDARAVEGLDRAIERAQAYIAAGADATFVEAPIGLEELARIPKALAVPQVANIVFGGKTPDPGRENACGTRLLDRALRQRRAAGRAEGVLRRAQHAQDRGLVEIGRGSPRLLRRAPARCRERCVGRARSALSRVRDAGMTKNTAPRPWDGIISAEEQRAYNAAGFGRSSGLGKRPALLIIDVQYRTVGTTPKPFWEAIKEFPTACGDVGWSAIHNIARLLDYFRERGWPVLYPHVSPKQSFDYGRLSDKVPAIMTVAAKGYEFVAEVAPREKDILLPKKHPSAFFGTPLASYLIEVGADTLVVTGCTTSGCVRGSVVDAFAYNFRVLVPEDAVYDRSATSHAVNLFDMASKYADVMPTGDALTALRAVG